MGWILVAIGVLAAWAAAVDSEWVLNLNHWKARPVVRLFGRTGARLVYGILGAGFVVLGVLMATGILPSPK